MVQERHQVRTQRKVSDGPIETTKAANPTAGNASSDHLAGAANAHKDNRTRRLSSASEHTTQIVLRTAKVLAASKEQDRKTPDDSRSGKAARQLSPPNPANLRAVTSDQCVRSGADHAAVQEPALGEQHSDAEALKQPHRPASSAERAHEGQNSQERASHESSGGSGAIQATCIVPVSVNEAPRGPSVGGNVRAEAADTEQGNIDRSHINRCADGQEGGPAEPGIVVAAEGNTRSKSNENAAARQNIDALAGHGPADKQFTLGYLNAMVLCAQTDGSDPDIAAAMAQLNQAVSDRLYRSKPS